MFLFHSVSCGACGKKMQESDYTASSVGEVWYEVREYYCRNIRCSNITKVIVNGRSPMLRRGMVTIPKILSPFALPGRWARLVQWAKEMVR